MKNNTKIRLHLSKQLFEALTKQVLAEAKANDGYTVAVKQPKSGAVKENAPKMPPVPPSKPKMPPVPASKPKVPPVPPLKPKMPPVPSSKPKMPPVPGKMEEKMSSKEKMAKGLYKEDAGALQPGENVSWLDGSQREYKGVVQSQEEGDYYKVKITAAPAGGHKEGSILTKQSGDLKKAVAEGNLDEISLGGIDIMDMLQKLLNLNPQQLEGALPILGTILGVGGTIATSVVRDLMKAKGKTPEEKKQILQNISSQIRRSKGQ